MTTTKLDERELMVRRAQADFQYKAEDIKRQCQSLIDRLHRAIHNCDLAIANEPYGISPLGVVQSAGSDIDRACAELAMHSEMIRVARYAARLGNE